MAVYTTLNKQDLQVLLSNFDLPPLQSFEGASSGIENTTYFLTLTSGAHYVLTVFENLTAQSLLPYITLTTYLNHSDLPVPGPCVDKQGASLQTIAGKPALLFIRSKGKHIEVANSSVCAQIGDALGRIHNATIAPHFNLPLANPCGLAWMKETFMFVKESLNPVDQKILQGQILLSEQMEKQALPVGIIHGDLFRDNVLFDDGAITAVIDFYNAGKDILLLDLAITANDWCYADGPRAAKDKIDALLDGYAVHRPLYSTEKASWNDCLQVAAARLWLSRLRRVALSRQGSNRAVKDPAEYKNLLLFHLYHV